MRAVLMYHSVDPSGSVVSIHPDRFREHVEILARSELPVLSLVELVTGSDPGVALTFDDAFQNFAETAWPTLSDAGLPATLYAPTAWMGRASGWDPPGAEVPSFPVMTWDTLGRLASEGVDVGSHARTHPRLTTLEDTALSEELEGSKEELAERLGRAPRSLAYPFGDVDDRVARAAHSAGYDAAVTTELRPVRDDDAPWRLPRIDAYYLIAPGTMERFGTPALTRYLQLRGAARRLRRSLRRARAEA